MRREWEDRALVKVIDALRDGRKPRGIAVAVYGEERVANEWYPDSGMRSQIRRWIPKAEALAAGGWRDLVPRHVPGE